MSWDGVLDNKLRRSLAWHTLEQAYATHNRRLELKVDAKSFKILQYQYKLEAKKDISTMLRYYKDLQPIEEMFTFPNRGQQMLLSLKGTIAVNFKGRSYNIPIQVWLFNNHPYAAPVVYVKPTSSMVIKPNKHVDHHGRVYLPYLSQWKAPQSDLYTLAQMLCVIFGEDCPVFSKPSPSSQPYPSHANTSPHMSHSGHSTGYPMMGAGGMPMPYGHSTQTSSYHPTSHATSNTPYPTAQQNTPYPVSTAYQPPVSHAQRYPAQPTRQPSVIKDEEIRASLLSTVEDKLKQRIRQVFQMGKIELDTLQATKFELEKGQRDLQEIITKMNSEKASLTSNIALLQEKSSELEDTVERMNSDSENMSIDDAVVTTAPLYNQILTLFAEESAVEDALYYIGEALRREAIELETFLKTTRMLSRRQFKLRATLLKARVTAGLSSEPLP